jgi:hypothetical protein
VFYFTVFLLRHSSAFISFLLFVTQIYIFVCSFPFLSLSFVLVSLLSFRGSILFLQEKKYIILEGILSHNGVSS